MKLTKAIETLDAITKTGSYIANSLDPDAIQLGIEALKRVDDMRISPCTTADEILSGETPETAPKRSLHHIKAVLESPLGREPGIS